MKMNEFISRYYDDTVAEAVTERLSAKLEPVEEGYVGKTTNLINATALLDSIIADVARTAGEGAGNIPKIQAAYKMNINKDPRIAKVAKLLEKEFNFAKMDLAIYSTKDANAFTLVRSKFSRRTLAKLPDLPTKHGKRFIDKNKQYVAFVVVYSQLFAIMSGSEIMAVILHEIGHNFEMAEKAWFADYVGQAIVEETEAIAREHDKAIDDVTGSVKAEIDILNGGAERHGGTWIDRLNDKILQVFKYIPITGLLNICGLAMIAPITWLMSKFKKDDWEGIGSEVYADSFATAYGFGPDLISGMSKFEDAETLTSGGSKKLVGTMNYLLSTFPMILAYHVDVHPENQARFKRQLNDLLKLANDPNTPPTTRKLVQRDYEIAKKMYDQYIDGNGSKVRRFVRQLQEKYFKGSMDMRGYALQINALTDEDEAKGIIMGGKQPIK